jgi:hypothetical protein
MKRIHTAKRESVMLSKVMRCVLGMTVFCASAACVDAHGFGHCGGFGCCRGWGWGYPAFGFGIGFGLGFTPGTQAQTPLQDDGGYWYNGDPSSVAPLPAPAPRLLSPNITPDGAAAAITSPALARERVRVTYPAYGEQATDVMVISQSKRD